MPAPFTVILPVRDGGAYVRIAVESMIAQTDPDWRLLVLENASTDDTVETVRSFNDPRIELLPAERPLDIYGNWHRALAVIIERVTGNPLVAFTGHDDYFLPRFVKRAKALAADDPDATLYQTLTDLVDGDGRLIRPCYPVAGVETWDEMAAMMGWGIRDSTGTGYFFRADDYVKVGGMPFLPRILYADHLLFLRLARLGHKRSDVETGCAYRFHQSSTSNAASAAWMNDRLEAFTGFVDQFRAEFGDFTSTDRGRAALTTWIGRELFVFDASAVRGAMTAENLTRLARLRRTLVELGGVAHPDHWSYQARPRPVRLMRRAKLNATYWKARLLAGRGGR